MYENTNLMFHADGRRFTLYHEPVVFEPVKDALETPTGVYQTILWPGLFYNQTVW